MSNYRPGPWAVDCRQITAPETEDHMGGLVATTRPGPFPRKVKNANARLIAAAPDMLEALKQAVTSMQDSGYSNNHLAVRAARDAIAKATKGDE